MNIGRTQIINNTKIQYISVADTKIYKVTDIDFCDMTIEASETDLSIEDIPESGLFSIEELKEFKIRLCNRSGMGEIVDFAKWVKRKAD